MHLQASICVRISVEGDEARRHRRRRAGTSWSPASLKATNAQVDRVRASTQSDPATSSPNANSKPSDTEQTSDPLRAKPCSETPQQVAHDIANGDCPYTFQPRVLNRFWVWRSAMGTFSNVAWFKYACFLVPLRI